MKKLDCLLFLLLSFLLSGSLPFRVCASEETLLKKEEGKIVLDNGVMHLSFSDGNQFKVLEMSDKRTSWLPEGGMPGFLWQITLKGPNGINPLLDPSNGVYEGVEIKENDKERASLVFKWKMRLSKDIYYPVRVLVSLENNSKLSQWEIETDLPAGWIVSRVDFPRLYIKRPETSKIIMPEGWGVEYDLSSLDNYAAQYPSHSGIMQLMCMHNGLNTLYFATHDKGASIKTFRAKGAGPLAVLSSEIVTSEAWTPAQGGTFRLPWKTSVGLHPDGWEKAVVEWYRPFTFETVWGSKSFASRNLPKWVLNADMWLRPHFTTEVTRTSLKKALDFFGPEAACHWYRWHQIEYDVSYPEYFPPREEFVPMMREVQKRGSHVIPYTNGRLWDPASKSYQQLNGKDASCRKEDGTLYTEVYGSMVPNSVTCPSSEIWQRIILDLTDRVQTELGSNGVYIDQVGAGWGFPCWAKNHNHPLGGGSFWHASYRSLLEKVRKNLRPDNILITEENAECYMDLFDLMLMVNTPQGDNVKQVPLFPLVYSDRMMVNCFLYYPATEKVNSLTFRMKNVMGLLWGSQLGWIKPELIMAPEATKEAEFLREMVRFRRSQHDLIYGGRFIQEVIPGGDNPLLQVPNMGSSPAVRGAMWIGPKGNKALLMVNMDDKEHSIQLPDGKELRMKALECIRIKGEK